MHFLIDNTDYTSAVDAERPPRIVRTLNRPSTLECAVILAPSGPVVPAGGARVLLERADGTTAVRNAGSICSAVVRFTSDRSGLAIFSARQRHIKRLFGSQ